MDNRANSIEHLAHNPMEGRLLSLDTLYSTQPDTPWDTSWKLARDNFINLKGFMVSMRTAELSNSVYNVNDNYNTVHVSENLGPSYPVTVVNGQYTAATFATALQIALNASPDLTLTYTVVYDPVTYRYEISVDVLPNVFTFVVGDNTVYHMIGYETNNFSSKTIHPADYMVNFAGTSCVYVLSNIVKENLAVGALPQVLGVIPINAPFGDRIYWDSNTVKEFLVPTGGIESVEIRLFDDRSNPWKISGNHPFRLELFLRPVPQTLRTHIPIRIA